MIAVEETNLEERRDYRRIDAGEPVRFEFKDPSHFGGCLSQDLSEGGLQVTAQQFVPMGTELSLEINLPNKKQVQAVAKVVWVTKARFGESYRLGLQFVSTDAIFETQKEIQNFIKTIN